MNMSASRLRFSPAPTGFLHIGSVRTALYNWLHARHVEGTFILRIEDTDVARSTQESVDQIQQVMHWLGLEWDEGPYLQSARFDAYLAAAQRLVEEGHAYECFCTEAEVKERNEAAMREGRAPGYDGRCRDLTPADAREAPGAGAPRLDPVPYARRGSQLVHRRHPGRGVGRLVDDLRFRDRALERHAGVLPRQRARRPRHEDHACAPGRRPHRLDPSGTRPTTRARARRPTGVRAHAADPRPRGREVVEAAWRGLGRGVPRRGLPAGRAAQLPGAARMGTRRRARDPRRRAELVAEFDLDRVNTSSATFDPKKLEWMNGEHIRALPLADLVSAVLPFARARYADAARHPAFRGRGRACAGTFDDTRADRRPDGIPLHRRRPVGDRSRVVGEGRRRSSAPRRSSTQ